MLLFQLTVLCRGYKDGHCRQLASCHHCSVWFEHWKVWVTVTALCVKKGFCTLSHNVQLHWMSHGADAENHGGPISALKGKRSSRVDCELQNDICNCTSSIFCYKSAMTDLKKKKKKSFFDKFGSAFINSVFVLINTRYFMVSESCSLIPGLYLLSIIPS